MIVERAQQLSELAEQKKALQKQVQQLQGFQTRATELTTVVSNLKPYLSSLRAFRSKGFTVPPVSDKADPLLMRIAKIEAGYSENPEWILSPANYQPQVLSNTLEGFKNALSNNLSLIWNDYTRQKLPTTNNELLTLLAKIKDFKTTVNSIRRISSRIDVKRANLPTSDDDFQAFDEMVIEVTSEWDKLGSKEVPTSVLEFLKAATTAGATLELYTDEVGVWITNPEHDISASFRIRATE